MVKIRVLFVSISLILFFSSLETPINTNYSTLAFEQEVEVFAQSPGVESANWGISVFSVKSEKELYSYNGNLSLIPASTLKALTTSTALMLLGAEYQYETHLMYEGEIDISGHLNGNIYIIGSGDPAFGSSAFHDSLSLSSVLESFYKSIADLGIKKIDGSIISDTRIFDNEMVSPKWLWEDIGNYFGAGTSGLSVNENEYTVYFDAAQSIGGSAEVVRVEPPVSGMVLHNYVTTAARGTGDNVYIYGAPYCNERRLTGTIPLGATKFGVRGSMPDPAAFFSSALHQQLSINNIEITGSPKVIHHSKKPGQTNIASLNMITSIKSPKLEDIAHRANMESINSYAESILKTISLSKTISGNRKEGLDIMLKFWKDKGVDISGVKLYDGSGLSPSNRITTNALAHAMAITANEKIFDSFLKGLPIAGQSGSLRNVMIGTASENNLAAKSGFLSNARAFTGYTTTSSGELITFALIVNDYAGTNASLRIKMNRLMNAITENLH